LATASLGMAEQERDRAKRGDYHAFVELVRACELDVRLPNSPGRPGLNPI
jgi:hypothetical protein